MLTKAICHQQIIIITIILYTTHTIHLQHQKYPQLRKVYYIINFIIYIFINSYRIITPLLTSKSITLSKLSEITPIDN